MKLVVVALLKLKSCQM